MLSSNLSNHRSDDKLECNKRTNNNNSNSNSNSMISSRLPGMLDASLVTSVDTPRRRLVDYTKSRGGSFDLTAMMMPTRTPSVCGIKKSKSSLELSAPLMARSFHSLESWSGDDSLGSVQAGIDEHILDSTSTGNEERSGTTQVEFLFKVPPQRLRRHRNSLSFNERTPVQELRDSFSRRSTSWYSSKSSGKSGQGDEGKKDHVGSERKLSASLPFDEDAFGGRRRQRRGIIQREIDSIVIKTSDEGESLGGDDDWSMMSSTVPRLKRAASIAELFKELQLETERNADYMKSPSNRSSGNMGAASAPPPSHKDSSPAA